MLLRALSSYANKEVAKVAFTAFGRHLWCLSEILVGFAFFDEEVTAKEKRMMVAALRQREGSVDPPNRIPPFVEPNKKELHDFVTKSTVRFFKILNLPVDFLENDPSEWGNQETYRQGQEVARSVKVVNDLAERGVALMQEFNASITRNEEQRQFLLQVVEAHRKEFSVPTKGETVKRSRKH
jgi:hypothetical protein